MGETKGFTWDYDVNSQKSDEGVKLRPGDGYAWAASLRVLR